MLILLFSFLLLVLSPVLCHFEYLFSIFNKLYYYYYYYYLSILELSLTIQPLFLYSMIVVFRDLELLNDFSVLNILFLCFPLYKSVSIDLHCEFRHSLFDAFILLGIILYICMYSSAFTSLLYLVVLKCLLLSHILLILSIKPCYFLNLYNLKIP